MSSTPLRTIAPPRPPELPPPHRFPVIATVAPVIVSLVLFAVTRSPFTLVFAVLGPVVALASSLDAILHRRRSKRREATRFAQDAARVSAAIDDAHRDERRRLDASTIAGDLVVRLGVGDRPSTLVFDRVGAEPAATDPHVNAALADLHNRASVLRDAPIHRDISGGVGVAGPLPLAMAVVRSLCLQLAASRSPGEWRVEVPADAEDWLAQLPHTVDPAAPAAQWTFCDLDHRVTIALRSLVTELPRSLASVLEVAGDGTARLGDIELSPELVGIQEATDATHALAAVEPAHPRLPDRVELRSIEGGLVPADGLTTLIGIAERAPVTIDLVRDGPHAIVGGTTGSGKSELLLSWVLGMAANRSPVDVSFLFVDFKGGASFGSLLDLPHSVGVITDLDTEQALRALASIAAELRFRERELAARSLRSIDDARSSPFPRLVVVVDEYAALVETFPTLHGVFADIAARGRSLGVHLILCTQRPAGVVRDGILANCALRISLRVTSQADSVAVLGSDDAARLTARPLGRAFVSIGGAPPTGFQVALSDRSDVERAIESWSASPPPRRPWLPPLPPRVPIESLTSSDGCSGIPDGVPFALADRPEEQAQCPIAYRPREHGSLLVIGSARSGKSGVLAALAATAAPAEVVWVPPRLAHLWDFVESALTAPPAHQRLALLDDLDSALSACDEAYQVPLTELLSRLLRDGPALGWSCVLTAQRVTGGLHSLASLCGSRLMLRMPSRAEYALAGGESSEFVPNLPPGGGHWHGARIQVGLSGGSAPRPTALRSLVVDASTAQLAVVSTRPEQFAATVHRLAPDRHIVPLAPLGFGQAAELEVSRGDVPPIFVADPELWQSQWTLFGTLSRSRGVLFDGCSLADLRTLSRSRGLPPPFPIGERPLWLREPDGAVHRATLAES